MLRARGAIILAAGASRRMGSPKALLPWAGTTLLDYSVTQARAAAVSHIVVVLGPATVDVASPLNTITVFNPEPDSGRSTSIRLGAAALPETIDAVLVQSVDQPTPASVIDKLFDSIDDDADIAIPMYRGRRGHPICFNGRVLPELLAVTEADQGLRSVVRSHQAHTIEAAVESESVLWNLNDPAAYAAAASLPQS